MRENQGESEGDARDQPARPQKDRQTDSHRGSRKSRTYGRKERLKSPEANHR